MEALKTNQTRWESMTTTTLSHHPYILCYFAKLYEHHETLHALSLFVCIEQTRYSQLCSFQPYIPPPYITPAVLHTPSNRT